MGPWAGQRNVQMIAAALGWKAAFAGGAGAAIGGNVIMERGGLADEMTVRGARSKLLAGAVLLPSAVDEQSHSGSPLISA